MQKAVFTSEKDWLDIRKEHLQNLIEMKSKLKKAGDKKAIKVNDGGV